jgi:hypothetical protein
VLRLDGPVIDLTDVATRQELEDRHAELLLDHGLRHLDLYEITTSSRRPVTQTVAAELFDRGAAGIRFPSRLDGHTCVALFEGRGRPTAVEAPIALTDPPPKQLINVTEPWGLVLEPAP